MGYVVAHDFVGGKRHTSIKAGALWGRAVFMAIHWFGAIAMLPWYICVRTVDSGGVNLNSHLFVGHVRRLCCQCGHPSRLGFGLAMVILALMTSVNIVCTF